MTQPIPGQLSLDQALAPDLTETATGVERPLPGNGNDVCGLTGPERPTRPGSGASDQTHAPNGAGGALPAPASGARSYGLADVPGALREFADVPPGRLAWRAWTPGTPAAHAALEYRQRLGTWPAAVILSQPGGLTLAGPVPAEVRP